jgi:hypothetical protein
MHTYSPSAGSETPVEAELSDKYELAGAEVSHGGNDSVSASGGGTDEGADVGGGGGFGPADVGAPEPQPATKKRAADAVATRRFIEPQTPAVRSRFRTVALPDSEALCW